MFEKKAAGEGWMPQSEDRVHIRRDLCPAADCD